MPHDLIVFGEDWGAHPSSTQHIARNLLEERKVLWVNSLGLRRPRLTARDFSRAAGKLKAIWHAAPSAAETVPESLSVIAPRALCWPASDVVNWLNGESLSRQIRSELARKNIRRPILWTSLPTALPVLGKLDERAVVYYCGDDFGALAGVDHRPVLSLEARLADKARLILAASPQIAARFAPEKTIVLPHGADIDLFSMPAPRAADLPAGGPIAGFYGSLSDWIDIDLLVETARALPHWTFVFIGPEQADVSRLKALGNTCFLGRKAHHDLPSYVQHWTVSLLPFKDNDQIRACNPLKLREYLAAGHPIAATPFPALEPFADLISLCGPGRNFADTILQAGQDQARNISRRASVQDASWLARAAQISDLLDQL